MVQVSPTSLTLDKFLTLPETTPASEYINGAIVQKPMPQGKHSILQRELSIELMTFFRTNKAAQVFPELRCTFSGRSIVPDLSIFRTSRIPKDANGEVANTFEIAPDWVIEILSPNQSQTRVIRNILHCLSSGTELGWLVDPDEACVFAYTSNQSVQIFDEAPNAFQSSLPVPTFAQALQLTTHDVFSWLQI